GEVLDLLARPVDEGRLLREDLSSLGRVVHRQVAALLAGDRERHAARVVDLADLRRLDVVGAVGVIVEREPGVMGDREAVEDVVVLVADDEEDDPTWSPSLPYTAQPCWIIFQETAVTSRILLQVAPLDDVVVARREPAPAVDV